MSVSTQNVFSQGDVLTDKLQSIFAGGFANGGPKGLVWGFILAWLGQISQVLVMAEIGSMSVHARVSDQPSCLLS